MVHRYSGILRLHSRIRQPRIRFISAVLAILSFSVIGYVTLHYSHAATYAVAAEAESGALAGNARVISDSTASGGNAVNFSENVHYVALGDSVASGEGINYGWVYSNGSWRQTGPSDPVWEPTTDLSPAVQDCHRSAQAYPTLVSKAMGYQLLNLSCSGSSIPDGVLGNIQFNSSTTGAAQLGSSLPGYAPPNTAYDTFKPDLVAVTLGMDDVDFSAY